ncbi:MAG TPA: PQQ-dependent sugar dehydrogenase [Rhizomicrobium sp.]|nr:PQQ-dependent sugar dehydrogenase [Rhizomicrobium sp.]
MRRLWTALLLAACAAIPASARTFYTPNGTCDGWPRADIGMAKGFCAGIVVAPPAEFGDRTIRSPRVILPLPGGTDFLVSDVGAWNSPGGKIWRITAEPGKPTVITPVITDLYMPHFITRGPNGKVYVNEQGRILRFDPAAADPQSTIETVIADTPDTRKRFNFHPLSTFLFDANNDMLVSVGAPSDQCLVGVPSSKDGKPDGDKFCNQSEGDYKAAGIRRYAYLGDGKWSPAFTMMAQGLRNSVTMVRHKSGTLLEGDNGVDFAPADTPFEELNVLKQGAHYGWPYCYDMTGTNPVWGPLHVMDCASDAHTKPVRLLPPHSAPLSMLYYDGRMFPQLKGKLLVSLHGYRVGGARLAAFTVDRHGIPVLTPNAHYDAYAGPEGNETVSLPYPGPASEPLLLTPGWNNVNGSHPMGGPLGLAVAQDGAIWVAEDRNATILRIARDRP